MLKGRLIYGRKPVRARLTAYAGFGPNASKVSTQETGDDGRFQFALPKSTNFTYDFQAELPGHPAPVRAGMASIIADNTELQQDFVIQSGEANGVVTDGDGKPISGAHVTLTTPGSYGSDASADSGADGTFHMMYVAEGVYAAVATQRGVGDGIVRDVHVSYDAPSAPITIRIDWKASGSVEVTPHEEGAGLLQSPIIALLRDGIDISGSHGFRPSSGTWTLRDVPEGEYMLRVSANGYCVQLRPVAVTVGQTTPVDVTLFKAADLVLQVLSPMGKPQLRAICTVTPQGGAGEAVQLITDADGNVAFKGLRLGSYKLSVETSEGLKAEKQIDLRCYTSTNIFVR